MIASLYQSGSSSDAECAGTTASSGTLRFGISVTLAIRLGRPSGLRRFDPKNVRLPHARVEPHVIPFPSPYVLHIVDEIVGGERRAGRGARDLDPAVLHVVGVEVHHDEQRRRSFRSSLAVRDDLWIVGRVKAQRA